MKKLFSIAGLVIIATLLSGCGQIVEPGFKAKFLSSSGYSNEIKEPGKYQVWWNEKLVKLDT